LITRARPSHLTPARPRPCPLQPPQGIHPASSEYYGSGSYRDPVIMAWIKDYNAKAGRAAASARVSEKRAALKAGKAEEKKAEAKAPKAQTEEKKAEAKA
jgi:hypothetical protein